MGRVARIGIVTAVVLGGGCAGGDDAREVPWGGEGSASTGSGASPTGPSASATDGDGTTSASSSPATTSATSAPMTGGGSDDSTGDPPPQDCLSDELPMNVTIGDGSEFSKVALPLVDGTEYGYLRAEVDFVFGDDNGTCFNPAAGSNQNEFPVFQVLLALKRGDHWCKGGSAYSITTQSSGVGPFIAGHFYKEEVWGGSGCGDAGIEQQIFNETHGLSLSGTYTAVVTFDRDAGTLTVEMDGQTYQGPMHPDVRLVGSDADPWHLVMSFDGGYLGCYGEAGDDRCCHIPSLSWQYTRLAYEACPAAPA